MRIGAGNPFAEAGAMVKQNPAGDCARRAVRAFSGAIPTRRMRSGTLAVLVLTFAVARAQPPTTATPPAQPERPASALGTDTPRGAMARFLTACRAGQYARAAEFLNLRGIPSQGRTQRGAEFARELETVLDRALPLDPEKLSDQSEGDLDDGLPALRDSLGTIDTVGGPVEVLIERVPQPGGPPVWKFAATTVAALPALYDEFGWGPLAKLLPAPFFEVRFLQIRLWQWIGLFLLTTAAWVVSRLVRGLLVRVAAAVLARRQVADAGIAEQSAEPLRLAVALVVFSIGLRFLALALPVHRVFVGAVKALAIVMVTWLLLRILDVLSVRVERQLQVHRRARAVATVPLGRRSLKVFLALIAFIAALQNFGFNVTGLIAGLGVGGLAVALAAQKTVENLFGSVSLVADQPVRVGDVCRFGDTVGTVEDIGLRSTRVRTIDRTVVTIPNAQFSTLALENLSRRDRIPVRATVTLPQGTSAEHVRQVLAALRDATAAQPKVDARSVRARFVRMGSQALELEIFAYVLTSQWDEFVDVREQIFLRALEVVGPSGAALK
jgi:MscS family membrane protein